MKMIKIMLTIILGMVLTTNIMAQNSDMVRFMSNYDYNRTRIVSFDDSVIVNTTNKKSINILQKMEGLLIFSVNSRGSVKFIFNPKSEPKIITSLVGLPYYITKVTKTKQ